MRPVRKITAQEENHRLLPMFPESRRFMISKRDPVKPEPEGTIVLQAFRVTGYDQDCDGSLMARLENIDVLGEATGWNVSQIGLYPSSSLVVSKDELRTMFRGGTHEP